MSELDNIVNQVPTSTDITWASFESAGTDDLGLPIPKRIEVTVAFSEPGVGFGEFRIVQDERGAIFLDTESSSRETVKRALARLVDGAVTDWDENPERHQQFNEVMHRQCGDACSVCRPRK